MTMKAVEATPDDAAAIAKLQVEGVKAAFAGILPDELLDAGGLDLRTRQWRGWLERSKTSTFVTRDQQTMTGFCTLHPAPEASADGLVAEIAALYVLPSHWRRGLGRVLSERALIEARARGFSQVVAWEFDRNLPARALCSRLGFVARGSKRPFLEGVHGDVFEVLYRLEL